MLQIIQIVFQNYDFTLRKFYFTVILLIALLR